MHHVAHGPLPSHAHRASSRAAGIAWLLALVFAVACSKDKAPEAKAGESASPAATEPAKGAADPAVEIAIDNAKRKLAEVEAAVTGPDPSKAQIGCAVAVSDLDNVRKGDKALADKLDQVCNHDLWIATLQQAVTKAEAARAAKPTENPLSECYSADVSMATEELTKAKRLDAPAQALLDRFAKVCPAK